MALRKDLPLSVPLAPLALLLRFYMRKPILRGLRKLRDNLLDWRTIAVVTSKPVVDCRQKQTAFAAKVGQLVGCSEDE